MILRVLDSQWAPFVRTLCSRQDVETAGLVLAERLQGGDVLVGRHFVVVPDDGYLVRRIDQLRIDPVAINRLVRRARDDGLSVITVHTHPGTEEPWFSLADNEGDSRLMPSLYIQMEGPHGSAVVAANTGRPAVRLWSESGTPLSIGLRVVGTGLNVIPSERSEETPARWFDRQRLALGEHGQAILRDLHVGIVGLGGTGSICFAQLAHLGVGRITVIDGDLVEDSNVSRIIGATSADVGTAHKVEVAARYAARLALGTCVRTLRGHLGLSISTAAIEGCDIVLSCVDRQTPRALMNRLSYEKAVPVIDMGSAFRVDGSGKVVAAVGRVVVVGPARPCLACWGHIDPSRLRIEALSPEDRALEAAEGYIQGADVPQPSVIAFNTMVAGAAVIELLRLVTGFAGADDPPARLSFDFESGTVRRNRLPDSQRCSICSPR
jgi:proteasome lid subunit RPN8/RPN11